MSPAGPHWWPAYVGIGSNLNNPVGQVLAAIEDLRHASGSVLVSASSLYRSAPMGPPDQPDYVNAVAAMLTRRSAEDLLRELAQIEDDHGRDRSRGKWGPRTLDLDLLVYGGQQQTSDTLILPHPGIAARKFVLLPLSEVAPQLQVPGLGSVASLLAALGSDTPRIEKIHDSNGSH